MLKPNIKQMQVGDDAQIRGDPPSLKKSVSSATYLHQPQPIKFIDLFAGIGGFRIGLQAIGAECVFTSEICKFARKNYAANHQSNHEISGDITQVSVVDIPSHDVLCAGFPCQPFSKLGMDKLIKSGQGIGFKNFKQGNAFFDIARILEHHNPAAFILENIPNLIGFDAGKTFKIILQTLIKLGYEVDYKLINASAWVPQSRNRLFLVGFKRGGGFYFDGFMDGRVFTPPSGPPPILADILQPAAEVHPKYTLSQSRWASIVENQNNNSWSHYQVFTPDRVAATLVSRYFSEPKHCLIDRPGGLPRKLTPRECARLMGFADNFKIVTSDTQAYRQFGNAVVPPVVASIAKYMHPFLQNALQK